MHIHVHVPVVELVVVDKLHQVDVHQQQSLTELRPLAAAEEAEQDMQQLEQEGEGHRGLQDREGVGHLDQGVGQAAVAQVAAEEQP